MAGKRGNVYMFVPNLIGYARILFVLVAFGIAHSHPTMTAVLYFGSFVCDELDGRFARMYNQSSTFGAVLDMVTDRTATAGLLALLGCVYPSLLLVWVSIMFLDVFSHWFQTYATLAHGHSTHKQIKSKSRLIRAYYRSRIFMGVCCVSCEVLYLGLYLLSHESFRTSAVIPWSGLSSAVEALLGPAAGALVSPGIPAVALLCLVALPGFSIKQCANVQQFRHAADMLVEYEDSKAEDGKTE